MSITDREGERRERQRQESLAEPLTESAQKAAKRFGVSVNTMLRLGREGHVPMLDLGPKLKRFPVAALKRLAGGTE